MLSQDQVVELRRAFAEAYFDKCSIFEQQKITHEDHSTTFNEVEVLTNQKCRIDFDNETVANNENQVAIVSQTITLFIDPTIKIKKGSKLRVTYTDKVAQEKVTKDYTRSGEPAIYNSHQEVPLELFKKYA